jgi:hypothetical protein
VASHHYPHCQRQIIAAWLPTFVARVNHVSDWLPHSKAVVRNDLGAVSPVVSVEKLVADGIAVWNV